MPNSPPNPNHKPPAVDPMSFAGWLAIAVLCSVTGLVIWRYTAYLEQAPSLHYWGWVAALLPAAMVAQQGLYLVFIKRHTVRNQLLGESVYGSSNNPNPGGEPSPSKPHHRNREDLQPVRQQAASQSDSYFDPLQLGLQYCLLTTFLGIVGVTLFYLCCDPPEILQGSPPVIPVAASASAQDSSPPKPAAQPVPGAGTPADTHSAAAIPPDAAALAAKGAPPKAEPPAAGKDKPKQEFVVSPTPYVAALRLGAAGAFIYVLIYLGRRNYQRDITSGAALWSMVQLVLGPTLAFTLAYFLIPQQPAEGTVAFAAVFFLAGLSPRLVADWVSDMVQRVWVNSRTGATIPPRLVALGQIRGITQLIESRLSEEGIEDATGLAMANPVRLLRNTPFDSRQIASWTDEAILMITLPQHWEALQKEGVTGAMDLAWYVLEAGDDDERNPPPTTLAIPSEPKPPLAPGQQPPTSTPSEVTSDLAKLAGRLNLQFDILENVAWRLAYDSQLELIWAIYESNGVDQSS